MAAAVHEEANSPEVNVVKAGFFHSFVQALLEILSRTPFFEAAFLDVPGITEVHLVPTAFEGLGVGEDFLAAASVNIVDAALDAAVNDIIAVFLEVAAVDVCGHPAFRLAATYYFDEALPVAAETDSGNQEAGSAASAVFHVGVVV
ncbi:hypothetical protein ES703_72839 [subsurface metagenome]